MTRPDVVFAHANGTDYVARFEDGDELRWYRWPAVQDGWRSRVGAAEALADACSELPPRLAALALRLSGVPIDD